MALKTLMLAALLATPGAAIATDVASPPCTAPAVLPAELAGWSSPHAALTAAASTAGLAAATLTPGVTINAALQPTPNVQYPLRPEKPGDAGSHGGLFGFTVPRAGLYRVALGSAAWIDVVAAGKPVIATAHGHGPDCSGIRKMVDLPLAAGPHVLQIAASGKPSLAVLVTRLP